MNVLLLTDELLPGGVSRHVIDLANGLFHKKHEVTVAATEGTWSQNLEAGIKFLDIGLLKEMSFRKAFFGFPRALTRLNKYISARPVDILHSHKRYSDAIGRILSRKYNIPHISTCHNTFSSMYRTSVFGDMTIAPSRAIESMLVNKFHIEPERICQIHLGRHPLREFTLEEKRNQRELLGIEQQKRIVASVGRIAADKDRATLLYAIKILDTQKALDNIVFVLLGDGDIKPEMIRLMNKLQISQRVKFIGSEFDSEGLFNVAEFCVLSSVRDGGTLYVNLEAASLAKPHVAANIGGIPEFVIHGQTGLLVEPQQPEQLAEQMRRLLVDPEYAKELGARARKLFYERHTYDRFIDETLAVYMKFLR